MATLEEATARFGFETLEYLDAQANVPVVQKIAAQGDVLIVRQAGVKAATTPIPQAGVVVASGREGHSHTVFGGGFFDRRESGVVVGTLTVPADAEVFLLHAEHGALQVAPGTYRIGRQREQADVVALVAD